MSQEHRLKLEKWQGPPHIHKMGLFSLFSDENKESLFRFFFFNSYPKLHSAALIQQW